MADRFPHRRLHERRAKNKARVSCAACSGSVPGAKLVLHHDHIMNFARDVLKRITPKHRNWRRIWDEQGHRFLVAVRFRPVYICETCNSGDGWAKVRGWCGVEDRVYGRHMSLTHGEMALVRSRPRGLARRQEAMRLWAMWRRDHIRRRRLVVSTAVRLLAETA